MRHLILLTYLMYKRILNLLLNYISYICHYLLSLLRYCLCAIIYPVFNQLQGTSKEGLAIRKYLYTRRQTLCLTSSVYLIVHPSAYNEILACLDRAIWMHITDYTTDLFEYELLQSRVFQSGMWEYFSVESNYKKAFLVYLSSITINKWILEILEAQQDFKALHVAFDFLNIVYGNKMLWQYWDLCGIKDKYIQECTALIGYICICSFLYIMQIVQYLPYNWLYLIIAFLSGFFLAYINVLYIERTWSAILKIVLFTGAFICCFWFTLSILYFVCCIILTWFFHLCVQAWKHVYAISFQQWFSDYILDGLPEQR